MKVPDYFDLAFASSMDDAIMANEWKDAEMQKKKKEFIEQIDNFLNTLSEEQKEVFDRMGELEGDIEAKRCDWRYRKGMIDCAFLLRYMRLLKE